MRSIKHRVLPKLVVSKLVVLAILGTLLSVSLFFVGAWALSEKNESGDGVISDHSVSVKGRVREVLFDDNQVWQSIVNSQLKVSDKKSNNIIALGYVLTGIDLRRPITFLQSQIKYFDTHIGSEHEMTNDIIDNTTHESSGPTIINNVVENGAGTEVDTSAIPAISDSNPLVFIYHTHNTEAYLPDSGTRYQNNGTDATVVETGMIVTDILRKEYNIPVVHSQKNHIWEPFWAAYSHSLQTLEETLNKNKSLKYVIDIHNDGVSKEMTTTKINGVKYARIYFVVGADKVRNPKWQKNYQFALRMQHKLEQRYPGLSRGILLQETARYNQHLRDNSILIEMGGYLNTLEEAKRSTKILADIIAEVVLEDITNKN